MQPSERESTPPDNNVLRIVPGVPFNPFENAESYYKRTDFEKDKEVPWDQSYDLFLRRKFNFDNIEGYIDIINEQFQFENQPYINPYGAANFVTEEMEDETVLYHDLPSILRFSFFLKNPRDFVALSNTGITFLSPEEQYILIHTYAPQTPDILHALDEGVEVPIVERHFSEIQDFIQTLKNVKDPEGIVELNVSYLWFTKNIEDLKKIKLLFERQGRKDDSDPDPVPPPSTGRALVAVG